MTTEEMESFNTCMQEIQTVITATMETCSYIFKRHDLINDENVKIQMINMLIGMAWALAEANRMDRKQFIKTVEITLDTIKTLRMFA